MTKITEPLDAHAMVKELTGMEVDFAEGFVEFTDDGEETIVEVIVFYQEDSSAEKRRLDVVYRLSRFNDAGIGDPIDISVYDKA